MIKIRVSKKIGKFFPSILILWLSFWLLKFTMKFWSNSSHVHFDAKFLNCMPILHFSEHRHRIVLGGMVYYRHILFIIHGKVCVEGTYYSVTLLCLRSSIGKYMLELGENFIIVNCISYMFNKNTHSIRQDKHYFVVQETNITRLVNVKFWYNFVNWWVKRVMKCTYFKEGT